MLFTKPTHPLIPALLIKEVKYLSLICSWYGNWHLIYIIIIIIIIDVLTSYISSLWGPSTAKCHVTA